MFILYQQGKLSTNYQLISNEFFVNKFIYGMLKFCKVTGIIENYPMIEL